MPSKTRTFPQAFTIARSPVVLPAQGGPAASAKGAAAAAAPKPRPPVFPASPTVQMKLSTATAAAAHPPPRQAVIQTVRSTALFGRLSTMRSLAMPRSLTATRLFSSTTRLGGNAGSGTATNALVVRATSALALVPGQTSTTVTMPTMTSTSTSSSSSSSPGMLAVKFARGAQGKGKYLGVDDFSPITLEAGTVLMALDPGSGTSGFFAREMSVKSATSAIDYHRTFQIDTTNVKGIRTHMKFYVVTKTVHAAIGYANAQSSDMGTGGGVQIYVPSSAGASLELLKASDYVFVNRHPASSSGPGAVIPDGQQ